MMTGRCAAMAFAWCLGWSAPVSAQAPSLAPNVTVAGGWAGFADEGLIHHGVIGAGAEWVATRHLAVGAEVHHAMGPGADRDLFALGVVRVGVLPFSRVVVPFVIAGAGIMRHSDRFFGGTATSTEGAFVVGGGVRVRLSPRVFVAPEAMIGWEPHVRVGVTVGITLR